MPNPYQATRLRGEPDSARDKATLLRRLRMLGLDDDGLQDVDDHWDDLNDDDWTPAKRYQLVRASDSVLMAAIRDRYAEFMDSTTTTEQQDIAALDAAVTRAEVEANDKIGGTVADVLAWVGDSRVRAMAASNLERGPDGGSRKTLTEALDRIINGS